MGVYDLPAMIDYILEETGQDKLFIIGFSQGTTTTLIMLSEKPDYNKKIRLFTALGPASYVGNNTNIFMFKMFVMFPIIIVSIQKCPLNVAV